MCNKQWVIKKIFSEKARKGQLLLELGSKIIFFLNSMSTKKFSLPNVLIDPIVHTGTYFVTKKGLTNTDPLFH